MLSRPGQSAPGQPRARRDPRQLTRLLAYARPYRRLFVLGLLATLVSSGLGLVFPKLFDSNAARVSAFVDFGNVYNGVDEFDAGELRASAGVALLWRAPVGPISISYAYPLRKEDGDELERLQFTFGGAF